MATEVAGAETHQAWDHWDQGKGFTPYCGGSCRVLRRKAIRNVYFEELSGCRGWAIERWVRVGTRDLKSRWTHGQGKTTDPRSCFLSTLSHNLPIK